MKNEITKLTDREHILLRPSMYIGGIDKTKLFDFIIQDNKIEYKSFTIIPGLIKIINEIIDNSIDACIRANFKTGTNISIKMDKTTISVKDDGTGIPVKKTGDFYMPELAWNHAKAGSNFDDKNRTTIGMNGVGSYCTNVWSKKFVGITCDGVNEFKFQAKDNASSFKYNIKECKTKGTSVTFEPDLERFKIKEIDETCINTIYQRLLNLSISYPQINFKFNNKSIKLSSFKKLVSLFSESAEIYENKNVKIAIIPNYTDDFKHYSFVNGLKIPDGGTHIDEITSKVVNIIREKLSKKYKSIKPGDIKNKITTIVFLNDFINTKFNSQSKEKITNSVKEFNDYANIDYSFANKILKNADIINPIIEIYKIKEEFENRKALKGIEKKKQLKSEKYFKSIKDPKYLCICEGFSAYGGLSSVLGNENIEYYVLKGKPLNAWEVSNQKLSQNRELSELYQILRTRDYEKVLTASDGDLDGSHINALLLGFYSKFFSDKLDKIGRLNTPIKAVMKNNLPVNWVYKVDEEPKQVSGGEMKYFKGLGTWSKEQLEYVVEKDGLENMIETYNFDNQEILNDFLSSEESDKRKDYILNHSFSIAKL